MENFSPKLAETQENRCRVCLEVTESTICLLNPANLEETMSYWDVLRLICKIETDINDSTPQIICGVCSDRAEVAYEFKMLCENSDKKLQSQMMCRNSGYADNMKIEFTQPKMEYEPGFKWKISTDPYDISPENQKFEFDFASDTSINSSCASYNLLNFTSVVKREQDFSKNIFTKDSVALNLNSIKFTQGSPEKENNTLMHNKIIATNTCPICGKTFKPGFNLKRHIKAHEGIRNYECKECGKRFMQRSGMIKHALSHSKERTHKCKECNATFKNITNLKRHMLTVHKNVKQFKCNVCPQKFASQYRLDRHQNQVHLNVRNHKCEVCGKTFAFKTYLKKHEGVHSGERPFACQVCGKKFKYSYSVERHMKLCHSGKRRYTCDVCGKKFKYNYSVNRHMKVCHFD